MGSPSRSSIWLAVAAAGAVTLDLAAEWLWRDLLYRVAVGFAGGFVVGRLLGAVLFNLPAGNALARTEASVVAFAGVLLCYGLT